MHAGVLCCNGRGRPAGWHITRQNNSVRPAAVPAAPGRLTHACLVSEQCHTHASAAHFSDQARKLGRLAAWKHHHMQSRTQGHTHKLASAARTTCPPLPRLANATLPRQGLHWRRAAQVGTAGRLAASPLDTCRHCNTPPRAAADERSAQKHSSTHAPPSTRRAWLMAHASRMLPAARRGGGGGGGPAACMRCAVLQRARPASLRQHPAQQSKQRQAAAPAAPGQLTRCTAKEHAR